MDDRVEDMDLVTARRSSQMSTSRRESGSYSRRNSHCSIIQTSEAVVLVQCRPDMGAENRKSIDIVTFDYGDVDTPRNSVHDTITEPGSGCDSSSSSSSGSLDVDLRHPPTQSQHYTTRVHVSSNCPSTKVQHHTNSSNYHSTHLQNPSNRLSTQLNTTSYCHPTKVQNRHSTQVLNSPEKPQSQIQSSSNRLSAQFQSSNRPSSVQSSSNRLSAQVYNNPNHLAQDQNNAKRLSVQSTPSHPPKQVEAPSRVSSQAQSSSDIELNIRQMEETQRRINLTLETLLQLRQTQRRQHHDRRSCSQTSNTRPEPAVRACSRSSAESPPHQGENKTSVKRDSGRGRECETGERLTREFDTGKERLTREFNTGEERLHANILNTSETDFLHQQEQNILNGNNSTKSSVDVCNTNFNSYNNQNNNCNNNNNQNQNSCRNSYQFSIESPVKAKIQGLINSVRIMKNRNSAEKEVVEKNIVSRDRKNSRTKETFSVEDFTELIKNLPANNFPVDGELGLLNQPQTKNVQFHIANELMTSERDYVANLKLICEDFPNFIIHSSQHQPPRDREDNFNNLPEIYKLSRDLSREFEYRLKVWDQHRKISDIFLHYRSHFNVYLPYLKNFSSMNKHFDERCSSDSQYRTACLSFEKLPQCRNLKIKHFLLKPVQRFPQYKLLLKDYLKHLTEAAEDYEDTVSALEIVTDLLKNANDVIL